MTEIKKLYLPEVERLNDWIEPNNSLLGGIKKIEIAETLVPHSVLEKYHALVKTTIGNTIKFLLDKKSDDYWIGFSFLNSVPKQFWKEVKFEGGLDKWFFYHFKGDFYKFSYHEIKDSVAIWDLTWLKEQPEVEKIADFSDYSKVYSSLFVVSAQLTSALDVLNEYSNNLEYNPKKYEKIVEVEKIVPAEDIYDPDLSVLRKDSEKVAEWREQHIKKYHSSESGHQGSVFVSNFELRKGWTGLGPWCDMVCTTCLSKAETLSRKAAEKLKKDATCVIEEIG